MGVYGDSLIYLVDALPLGGGGLGGTVVIGVRVPKWLKEELERLGINYAEEIREFLLRRVREERLRRLAAAMDEVRRRSRRAKGRPCCAATTWLAA